MPPKADKKADTIVAFNSGRRIVRTRMERARALELADKQHLTWDLRHSAGQNPGNYGIAAAKLARHNNLGVPYI